ncbi:MAG: metallophosphoesterase family protein [bacterium]|nr:MAG: metallophosphoesterase family protein [bacterium]
MNVAVLADVHSNLPALEAVVEDFQQRNVTHVWHLGDAIGYGAEPYACLQLLADLKAELITGNHELAVLDAGQAMGFNSMAREAINWTRRELSEEIRAFLETLAQGMKPLPGVYLFHGLPGQPNGYLRTAETAEAVFSHFEENDPRIRIAFFGHTHRPMIFTHLPGGPVRMFEPHEDLMIAPGRRYLVNPGSVGQPRNRNPFAQYLIYRPGEGRILFRRVEYNVREAQSRIIEAGLPPSLAARLSQGL